MSDVLEGLFTAFAVAGVTSALVIVVLVVRRPKWAHLDYDAMLWRFAYADTRKFIIEQVRAEMFVLLGTFLGAFIFQAASSVGERFLNGFIASGGALALGAPLLFVWRYTDASWKLFEIAKTAPYNADVTFWPRVDKNELVMVVRNHLGTGLFSAQANRIGNGIENWTGSRSFPWRDTPTARREIVHKEEQCLKLLRFEAYKDEERPGLRVFAYEGGEKESERQINLGGGLTIGTSRYEPEPLQFDVVVTDCENTKRPVRIWVGLASNGIHPSVETHLIRDY